MPVPRYPSAEMKIESTWNDLDRQACEMEAMGEQDLLAQQALANSTFGGIWYQKAVGEGMRKRWSIQGNQRG